jgi:hypothetical protein
MGWSGEGQVLFGDLKAALADLGDISPSLPGPMDAARFLLQNMQIALYFESIVDEMVCW